MSILEDELTSHYIYEVSKARVNKYGFEGIQKPEEEIFQRCMDGFSVNAEECIYVGDGGSEELETVRKLGMKAIQAAWYLKEGTTQPAKRKHDFFPMENPLDVLSFVDM